MLLIRAYTRAYFALSATERSRTPRQGAAGAGLAVSDRNARACVVRADARVRATASH
jgi:hypothetical protein